MPSILEIKHENGCNEIILMHTENFTVPDKWLIGWVKQTDHYAYKWVRHRKTIFSEVHVLDKIITV